MYDLQIVSRMSLISESQSTDINFKALINFKVN